MPANRNLEIGTGLFVLLGFVALLFLTTQLPGSGLKLSSAASGYQVTARFDNIGDLKPGAPVSLAGVRIGEVQDIAIDPQDFKAVVKMRIATQYNTIPDDSDAGIQTQGLLGGKYVGVNPGGSESYLKEGSTIEFTQSAIVLENLVNRLFSTIASRPSGGDSAAGEAAPAPAPTTTPDAAK